MCLMHTDLPVPDGPRIIEIWPSGMPRLRPFRTVLRPKVFLTSMNSTASDSAVESRLRPVCHWYSSARSNLSPCGSGSSSTDARVSRVGCSCWSAGGGGGGGGGGGRLPLGVGLSAGTSCWRVSSSLCSSMTSPRYPKQVCLTASAPDWGIRVEAPEHLCAEH